MYFFYAYTVTSVWCCASRGEPLKEGMFSDKAVFRRDESGLFFKGCFSTHYAFAFGSSTLCGLDWLMSEQRACSGEHRHIVQ